MPQLITARPDKLDLILFFVFPHYCCRAAAALCGLERVSSFG